MTEKHASTSWDRHVETLTLARLRETAVWMHGGDLSLFGAHIQIWNAPSHQFEKDEYGGGGAKCW